MAAFNIAPPAPFCLLNHKIGKWICRFDRLRKSYGLAEKPEPDQLNTLIYMQYGGPGGRYFAVILFIRR